MAAHFEVLPVTGSGIGAFWCKAYPLHVLVEPRGPVDGSRWQEGEEECPHVPIEDAVPLQWL